MNNVQLQFQFPDPGNWGKLTMTAVFPDNNGFVQSRRFTRDNIPANQAPALSAAISAVGSLGGFGVLVYAVSYTIKLLKRKDDIIDARDRQIRELTMQLISNCKNCDLAKAANKALIDDEN